MPLRILVVDPNPVRRSEYQRALVGHDVSTCIEQDPAKPPDADVVLLSLTQAQGHGLDLGRALKKAAPALHVVVYGKLPANLRKMRDAAATFGVDRVLPAAPEPGDLVALLDAHVQSLRRAQRNAAGTGRRGPTWGELLSAPLSATTMKALLTKDLRSA